MFKGGGAEPFEGAIAAYCLGVALCSCGGDGAKEVAPTGAATAVDIVQYSK